MASKISRKLFEVFVIRKEIHGIRLKNENSNGSLYKKLKSFNCSAIKKRNPPYPLMD